MPNTSQALQNKGIKVAYLVGTRSSAVVDGKKPRIEAFLRSDTTEVDYHPSSEDPMQWHGGPPTQARPLAEDLPGLGAGLEDLIDALDQDRAPAYSVEHARQLMEILIAGYQSILQGYPLELPLQRRPF